MSKSLKKQINNRFEQGLNKKKMSAQMSKA